jgi:hypothetical protein
MLKCTVTTIEIILFRLLFERWPIKYDALIKIIKFNSNKPIKTNKTTTTTTTTKNKNHQQHTTPTKKQQHNNNDAPRNQFF